MLIIAGLGNPGPQYVNNRHNIGAITAGAIARRWDFAAERRRFSSLTREGQIETPDGPRRALVLKPLTFYNESGRAVGEALRFYKLAPDELVVFYDEIDLAPGRFRVKTGGGAAGNNGVRSITAAIGPDFRRARMGTGHPGHKDLVHGHVLSDFHKADHPWVRALVEACSDALPLLAAGEDERYQAEGRVRLAPATRKLRSPGARARTNRAMLPCALRPLANLLRGPLRACRAHFQVQSIYWLWIILAIPWLGALVYLVRRARAVGARAAGPAVLASLAQGAREVLDPNREYREARAACEDSPTVHNRMRLARAAATLGRHDEAQHLYGEAAQGIHADDPTLLLGRAVSLIELGRHDEALALLDRLGEDGDRGRTPAAALALGRAYEGLGRMSEADVAYEWAAGRLPGLEGVGRYAAFLARQGRRAEAQDALAEMDRRIAKANPQFRRGGPGVA